jgi:hypothetical protein
MWDNVECIAYIKTNEINISYQINDGRFRFRGAVLIRPNFKLQIMRRIIINNSNNFEKLLSCDIGQ